MNSLTPKVEQVLYFHNTYNSSVYKVRDNLTIGRDESCDICLSDESISSKHLKVFLKNSHTYIVDLGSSNGTKVNSINISKGEEVRLRVGDNINIGNVCLQLSRKSKPLTSESNFSIITSRDGLLKQNAYNNGDKLYAKIKPLISVGLDQAKAKDSVHVGLKKLERNEKSLIDELEMLKERQDLMHTLAYEIENFDIKNKSLFTKGPDLKKYYKSNKDKYDEIVLEIPRLEAKLKLLKVAKDQMENQFNEYEKFNNLEKKRSQYAMEYKTISREKIDEKLEQVKKSLREVRVEIARQNDEIDIIQKNEKFNKQKEKEKIAKEIKKLQEKLGDAS